MEELINIWREKYLHDWKQLIVKMVQDYESHCQNTSRLAFWIFNEQHFRNTWQNFYTVKSINERLILLICSLFGMMLNILSYRFFPWQLSCEQWVEYFCEFFVIRNHQEIVRNSGIITVPIRESVWPTRFTIPT